MEKGQRKRSIWMTLFAFILVSIFVLLGVLKISSKDTGDGWCGKVHETSSYPPEKLISAMDYFEKGNYEYDRGNCTDAVGYYNVSIKLNPEYPQGYNNRGYTYMRLREFDKALPDFDMALNLDPNYINALRNRADVYNHNKDYQKAIQDYERAISLGGDPKNLCGDLLSAKHGGGDFSLFFIDPIGAIKCMKQ